MKQNMSFAKQESILIQTLRDFNFQDYRAFVPILLDNYELVYCFEAMYQL